MAINVAGAIPSDWDYQLGDDSPLFFGGTPPNVVVDAAGVQWGLGELDGWDSPDLRRATFDNEFHAGASLGKAFQSSRVLAGTGMMIAPDTATLEDAMERLRLALPLNDDVPLVGNETVPKYLSVRRSGRVLITRLGLYPNPAAKFSIGMIAHDPRKYALLSQSITLSPAFGTSGATFPWSFPVMFAPSLSLLTQSLSNSGTTPAPVSITFYGPLSSPTIVDRVSGYRLGLAMDVPDGRAVTIDTELGTVLLDGESVYDALTVQVLEPLLIQPRAVGNFLLLGSGLGHATLSTADCWE